RVPGALDELHDADPFAAAKHPQSEPECRRRLALAGTGVDDEQAFLDRLLGDFRILHGLALFHLGAMALRFALIDGLAHGFLSGSAAVRPPPGQRGRPTRRYAG